RDIVLGPTGRNFAAGMSGGIAYVLDENESFASHCNKAMVYLNRLEDEDEIGEVKQMIRLHGEYTDSTLAWKVLAKWGEMVPKFVKVLPKDFHRMLESIKTATGRGLNGDEAVMEAFVKNKEDKSRVEGI
ncbi:MAG: hypothetical protein WDZ53_00990, partial [Balneolales bacterium]